MFPAVGVSNSPAMAVASINTLLRRALSLVERTLNRCLGSRRWRVYGTKLYLSVCRLPGQ